MNRCGSRKDVVIWLCLANAVLGDVGAAETPVRAANLPMTCGKLQQDDGYRGIWYYNQPTQDEYK